MYDDCFIIKKNNSFFLNFLILALLTGTGNDFNSLLLPVILPVVSAALLPILPGALSLYFLSKSKGNFIQI